MSINFKKILLAGTALVAASAFAVPAQASDTITVSSTWGITGNGVPATGTGSGDAIVLNGGIVLTVTNNQTASDGTLTGTGGALNNFALGAISNAANTGQLIITGVTPNDMTVNIASYIPGTGAGATNISNGLADAVTVVDAGVLTSSGLLSMVNNATTAGKAINVTIGGALTTVGNNVITASTVSDSTLTLNGAGTNDFGTKVTLTDVAGGTGGKATIVLGGTAAQTVLGAIAANANDEGVLTITNSFAGGGVTDAAAIGTTGAHPLHAINAGVAGTVTTLSGGVAATTLNVTGTGTVAFGAGAFTGNIAFGANDGVITVSTGTITGNIDETATGTSVGTLTTTGAATYTGSIGATQAIKTLNTGGGADTYSLAVKAVNTHVTGANNATFTQGLTSAANFDVTGGTITIGNGFNMTGAVTASGNFGTLAMAGAGEVTGQVGTATTGVLTAVTVAGAGVDNFDNIIYATTMTLAGASTDNLKGGFNGTTLAYGGSGATVVVSDGKDITAAITSTTASSILTLSGTTTVSGVVGTGAIGGGNELLTVNAGATGKTDTFSSTMSTTNLNVTGNGNVALNGTTITTALAFTGGAGSTGTVTVADTKNFTGTINGTGGAAGTGIGNLVFAGTSTSTGAIGGTGVLKGLTLSGGSSTVQKTLSVTGAVAAADMTALNGNVLAASTNFVLGAGQTLSSTIYNAGLANYGHVTDSGVGSLTATSAVALTNYSTAFIPSTTAFTIINGTSTNNVGVGELSVNGVASTGLAGAQVVTAGLLTYTETPGANGLVVTVTHANPGTVALTGNGASVGTVLNQANTTTGVDAATFAALQGNLQNATSAAGVTSVLSSVAPTVDGSSSVAALNVGSAVQGLADTRIASLRAGDAMSGVAAGASANGWNMWVQGYGQHAQQDMKDLIAGYKADTWGGAVGVDSSNMISNGVLGVAFNYGYTTADSSNANTTATKVDNYGFNLYGSYDVGQEYFVNGQLGYAYNKITDDRHNVGGVVGLTAHGDTNSDQYMAKVGVGRDFAQDRGLTLTPSVSAAYTHLATKGFTETGAGGLDNVVGSSSLNDLKLTVGVNAAWNLKNSDGSTMKPALHVGYGYDALNDRVDMTSSFVGDSTGTAFTTEGPTPDRSSFNAGAGIVYATTANWDLSANYDYTYKSNYDSHTGVIRATSHF